MFSRTGGVDPFNAGEFFSLKCSLRISLVHKEKCVPPEEDSSCRGPDMPAVVDKKPLQVEYVKTGAYSLKKKKKIYLCLLLQSLCSGVFFFFLKFSWIENAYIKTKPKSLTDVPWQRKGCRHSKELRKDRQSYMDTGKESQINVCGYELEFLCYL